MPDFSSRLRELRRAAHLTQAGLAVKTGISRRAIGEYECNRSDPTLTMICSLADFFGVSTDYLLGRSEKCEPNK